jgi:NADH-quinone oxidoreductase subunit L
MTFHGVSRASEEVLSHVHEAPKVMTVPLIFLAIGAIGAGFVFSGDFIGDGRSDFWGDAILVLGDHDIIEAAHHVPLWVKILPILMGATGIALAWLFYIRRPSFPIAIANSNRKIYLFLLNKWYFDELYEMILVRPAKRLGYALWKIGDGRIIDGFGPDGLSNAVQEITRRVVRLQSGFVYHYAFAMLIGVAALASWFIAGGGGH